MIITILVWAWSIFGAIAGIIICGCSFIDDYPDSGEEYIEIGDMIVNIVLTIFLWLFFCVWPLASYYGYY